MCSVSNLNLSVNQDILKLNQLASDVDASGLAAQRNLPNFSRSITYFLKISGGKMPDWATNLISAHKQLELAVREMEVKGQKDQVPDCAIKSLEQSEEVLRKIAKKVGYTAFHNAVLQSPESTYLDQSKLLIPLNEMTQQTPVSLTEWQINFGLLYSAYLRTDNEEIRTKIRFLMINYLAKAAFLNAAPKMPLSDEYMVKYQEMLQLGQLTLGGMYHRTTDSMQPFLDLLKLDDVLGSRDEIALNFIPMDILDVQGLFPVSFVTTPDITETDTIVSILVAQFEAHIDRFPDKNLEFPVLIDVTCQMGQSVLTDQDPQKIQEYNNKQQAIRIQFNEIVKKAAEVIKAKYPDREDIQSKVSDYLKTNTAVVSRTQIRDRLAVLNLHSRMFDETDFETKVEEFTTTPDYEREMFLSEKIKGWSGIAGVTVGAVNFRRIAADVYTDCSKIVKLGGSETGVYAVPGRTDVMFYSKPSKMIDNNVIRSLASLANDFDSNNNTAQSLLASVTVKMINTLATKITEENWTNKQEDPAVRELTQTAVFRMLQHLATAVNNQHDFRMFSQAIDRAHAELTVLLLFYAPFDPDSFAENYTNFIKANFPNSLTPLLVGVARSAMNAFTGVIAAVLKNNPNAVRICGSHSYYEQVELLGETRSLQDVLEDPTIDKVDLYVGEFYHNIDIDLSHTHYQKGTVIQDIKSIFEKKPNTDTLTVVIDATIDFAVSDDIKELLGEFETEIREGRLNIVILRSGQKFDMFGLDNYYGSPYYIVNNGDKKWDAFNTIKTDEVFQTDELSLQYFSWMVESAPEMVDQYKKKIFDNSRAILDMVPASLKPENSPDVCVCSFDEDVKTPFIDIKIDLKDGGLSEDLRMWIQEYFVELFTSEDKVVYCRGSFGFAHPNITWVEPKMRINPGLDSKENELYQKFFLALERKVQKMKARPK